MTKHWAEYAPGASLLPYRRCLVCGQWRKNWWYRPKPLIHKGKKPRR